MFPSLRGYMGWKRVKIEGTRRAADGMKPRAIIDLTVEIDPAIRELAELNSHLYLCPHCLEAPVDPVSTECGHVLCQACMIYLLQPFKRCPMCKKKVTEFFRLYF
ncbi:polycomb group RING finger protein 1-like [Drosophila subpulchrella]|uniref:polycomb group RING finger protein 1-like n=1 Tax=Drosophila subpulchrella TaxID=1486046 RepID=UPI0018A15987|nr:polycomb group RING finger protein 1-like [Drosophila subpulchrella]